MTVPDWPRPLVYFSIDAVDPERQRRFYSQLFNWNLPADRFAQIPAGLGAPENGISGHLARAETPGLVLYFQVRDLPASLALASELGAREIHPTIQIPGGATIARVIDPEGNPIVLVQQ